MRPELDPLPIPGDAAERIQRDVGTRVQEEGHVTEPPSPHLVPSDRRLGQLSSEARATRHDDASLAVDPHGLCQEEVTPLKGPARWIERELQVGPAAHP